MARRIGLILALGLLAAACGSETAVDGAAPTTTVLPTTTVPSTTTATTAVAPTSSVVADTTPSVRVVEGLVYRSGGDRERHVDVYHSSDLEGGPVVVLFHGDAVTKSNALYQQLAKAIADQGGVAFVPNWGSASSDEPDELAADLDGAGCAIAFALAHAVDYGGSPNTLVLAGHSSGAAPASIMGVRDAAPVGDCSVEMAPFRADRMVLWDGDLMLGGPLWDRYGDMVPAFMEAGTVWTWLADAPRTPTVLVTGDRARIDYRRCDVSDPAHALWLRDPDGWFREHLEAQGALDDGCVDIGDAADLLADTMAELGFDVTHVILDDSRHMALSDTGQAQLVSAILAPTSS